MIATPVSSKRIIVTMDSAVYTHAILDMALGLAASLDAEVEGVFVEDLNLLNLSSLPFLREIKVGTLVETAINTEQMLRDMKAQARQIEQVLLQRAALRGIACTFRTWRGHTTLDALRSSFDMDFLRLAQAPVYRHGSFAKTIRLDRICVIPNDALLMDKALHAARQFSIALDIPVRALFPVEICRLIETDGSIRQHLTSGVRPLDYACFSDIAEMCDLLMNSGRSMLVVSSKSSLFDKQEFSHLLDKTGLPVMILHQS